MRPLHWLLIALSSLGLVGCFSPSYGSGTLQCASQGKDCPNGYHCAANLTCWVNGQDPDLGLSAADLAGDPGALDGGIVDLAEPPRDFTVPDGSHAVHVTLAGSGAVQVSGASHQITLSVGQPFLGAATSAQHSIHFGVLRGTQSK